MNRWHPAWFNSKLFVEKPLYGPPIISTLYIQQWALRKLTVSDLFDRVRVMATIAL